MTQTETALLSAVRTALSGQTFEHELFGSLSPDGWAALHRLSAKQGLQAVVYDALNGEPGRDRPRGVRIPQQVAIRWMLGADSIERNHARQIEVGKSVAEILSGNGIPALVLKGLAVGTFYSHPEHRVCGDIDLYTGEAHAEVDALMAAHGAEVRDDYYVHSHIFFRGVTIENHRFFNPVRGNRERKALERHFRELMKGETSYVPGTALLVPPPDFNALFLTMHAMKHFIYEGIRLRHVTDWAMFLKAEQNNVDWGRFFVWTDRMRFTKFAVALTFIAVRHIGLEIHVPELSAAITPPSVAEDADMILEDILRSDNSVSDRGYPLWRTRVELVRNAFTSLWKYHRICHKSALAELSKSAFGILFDRNPGV